MSDNDNVEVLARRRLALIAQREEINAAIDAIDTRLIDAVEVGGVIEVGGVPAFKVTSRRGTFDVGQAEKIVPPELIERATVTTTKVDAKALAALLPPALVDACRRPSSVYIAEVKS